MQDTMRLPTIAVAALLTALTTPAPMTTASIDSMSARILARRDANRVPGGDTAHEKALAAQRGA